MFHFEEFDVSIGIAVITCALSYLRLENRRTRMKLKFKYLKRNVRRCLELYLVHFKLYVGEQGHPGEIAQTHMLSWAFADHICHKYQQAIYEIPWYQFIWAPRKLISCSVRAAQAYKCPPCRTRFGYVRWHGNKMKQSIILSTHSSVFDFCNDRTEYLDASAT